MLIITPVHSDVEIETAIIDLGRKPGGGLVVMPDGFMTAHRVPVILAAARNNVPAVYYLSAFVRDGGLLSYGPDLVDPFRRAALAVLRFTAISNFVGNCTGRSPGFAPRRIRST
jgi:putative ABC transport system substrate-binding protein